MRVTHHRMAFMCGRPERSNTLKQLTLICAAGLFSACASTAALAHVDVGVTFGVPAPIYVEPAPAVVYAPPPPAVYAPAPVYYGEGYGYGYGYRDDRRWHDHGHHRGWHRHHDDDDD